MGILSPSDIFRKHGDKMIFKNPILSPYKILCRPKSVTSGQKAASRHAFWPPLYRGAEVCFFSSSICSLVKNRHVSKQIWTKNVRPTFAPDETMKICVRCSFMFKYSVVGLPNLQHPNYPCSKNKLKDINCFLCIFRIIFMFFQHIFQDVSFQMIQSGFLGLQG